VAWDWFANRLPGRRSFLYWIGTDAQHLVRGLQDGSTTHADLRAVRRARNLAGAARLAEELEGIGVSAEVVPFPTRMPVPKGPPAPMPAQMTVLTYCGRGRETFYGLPQILDAARRLPDVSFVVMGTVDERSRESASVNVTFTGWVADPAPLFDDASVVVRLIEHDGGGGTMAEGLQHARPVIYSMHEPHTIHVAFGNTDGLITALMALREQHRADGVPLELAGREYALREFDPDTRFGRLLAALLG
jgi:glycosyltransferase involved in cell wall biosynthesis